MKSMTILWGELHILPEHRVQRDLDSEGEAEPSG
jgi:hypothetical protein